MIMAFFLYLFRFFNVLRSNFGWPFFLRGFKITSFDVQ